MSCPSPSETLTAALLRASGEHDLEHVSDLRRIEEVMSRMAKRLLEEARNTRRIHADLMTVLSITTAHLSQMTLSTSDLNAIERIEKRWVTE